MSSPIHAFDNFLSPDEHAAMWAFLNEPGWNFGAFSKQDGARYFFKHFAGIQADQGDRSDVRAIEAELQAAPVVQAFWERLKAGPLKGQLLGRSYANALPAGVEGSLHLDSNLASHLTAIYYPHPAWDPDFAGETLFYNASRDEVVAAVYPKPNRLVVFPGVIPHVARAISGKLDILRITLMFKTLGPAEESSAA